MNEITEIVVAPGIVRRADRGLCIEGTRITLYLIEDYLRAGWTHDALGQVLQLTEKQISQVLDYLATHSTEFNREYDQVANQAAEREEYWRQRERQRRRSVSRARHDVTPEKAAAWSRFEEIARQEQRA